MKNHNAKTAVVIHPDPRSYFVHSEKTVFFPDLNFASLYIFLIFPRPPSAHLNGIFSGPPPLELLKTPPRGLGYRPAIQALYRLRAPPLWTAENVPFHSACEITNSRAPFRSWAGSRTGALGSNRTESFQTTETTYLRHAALKARVLSTAVLPKRIPLDRRTAPAGGPGNAWFFSQNLTTGRAKVYFL